MVLLFLLLACGSKPSVESIYLSGGNWQIHRNEEFNAELEGIVINFQVDRRQHYYCIYECSGKIEWPTPILDIDIDSSTVSLNSLEKIAIRAMHSDLMIRGGKEVNVHMLSGDLWMEAFPESSITILSSDGDVDVNLPSSDWQTRLFGDDIINQVTPDEYNKRGFLEVYSVNGSIRVIEVASISQRGSN